MVVKVVKEKKNYIDNKRFQYLVLNFSGNQGNEEYVNELVKNLDLLITNILMSFGFKVDHDDAKQECFVLCFKVIPNFTEAKGSAFNYFTTVILNNLKLIFTKNKKYMQKIAEYRKMHGEETNFISSSEEPD